MNKPSFFYQIFRSRFFRLAAATIIVLAWSSLAFCGEIHDAVKGGNLKMVKKLLKMNPNLVFSKGENGKTPLHITMCNFNYEEAKVLLASKADVNAKDNDGNTPLHCAALEDYQLGAELLLTNRADVNATNNCGQTPLHLAAFYGYNEVANVILANKADVNVKDKYGMTPLHSAAKNGHKDIVESLLANAADVNATNNYGKTPLDYAAACGVASDGKMTNQILIIQAGDPGNYKGVAELLRQHGGHE